MPAHSLPIDAPLDRSSSAPSMQRQLHRRFKDAILDGRLAPGARMPGSRTLAEALSISRNTVTAAYDLLAAEGYVEPDRQGTRVAALSLSLSMSLSKPARSRRETAESIPALSRRVASIASHWQAGDADLPLRPGVPALTHFPLGTWRRAVDRAIRQGGHATLGYGDPLGEPVLRASIARHLGVARGVSCDPARVVITEGAQEALTLCVRLLTNPGDIAWVEDPGYRGAKAAMRAGDLRMMPMRVDTDGLHASAADWETRTPRLIYTTPSHQYPAGAVLTAARRLDLIDNARQHGAWIIEDDYDSEFRHAGEPIGAMQGLVPHANVLYAGTFSKTMFPSLRIGFLVLPEALAARARAPLEDMLRGGHRYEQLALAEFIESGQFSRHLGRMRRLYRERQHALREALLRHMPAPVVIEGGFGGMHLTVRLDRRYPDRKIADAARRCGMAPLPLSSFALKAMPDHNGLVIGYGNTATELFEPLVKRLGELTQAIL